MRPSGHKFKIIFGPELAKGTLEWTWGTRVAGLRRAKLRPAGRCATELTNNHNSHNRRQRIASIWAQIQNQIRAGACEGHTRADLRTRVAGLRKLRPARPYQGRNSRFKIKFVRKSCLGVYFSSGCSLRRVQRRRGVAGLRRPQAAARTVLTDLSNSKKSPQPSGRACDVEE